MARMISTIRKDRRDGVTDEIKRGPTHIIHIGTQTWCGRKIRGFSVWNNHGTLSDVDCKTCLTAHQTNRPRSWKSR